MSDIFGPLEKALGAFSAWICAALAVAAYFVRPVIPADHRWIAEAALWVFALVAVAKVLEGGWTEGRRVLARRQAKKAKDEKAAREKVEAEAVRAKIVGRLDHLSDDEIELVAGALKAGSQTIQGWLYWAEARGLEQKGLIISAPGEGNMDHWPWTFPDDVWAGLQGRKEAILARAKALEPPKRR
jgi:hypothetical protein